MAALKVYAISIILLHKALNVNKIKCLLESCILSGDGSVSKLCTSGAQKCKTIPILGLCVLVHPN